MKKTLLLLIAFVALSSCATIFTGRKSKVTFSSNATEPVDLVIDGKRYHNLILPKKVKVRNGFQSSKVKASSPGYISTEFSIDKRFNGVSILNLANPFAWGIDVLSGAVMKPKEKQYYFEMIKEQGGHYEERHMTVANNYVEDPTIPSGEAGNVVTRDNPGGTDLEKVIIRWYFDSDPRGARIFWRVISSVPAEVKNTNELYLMTTPFEETRSFNILGLTYETSRDVQIEIKLTKKGYMDQVKRFNVRQAIDQQEISSFFELVPID